METVGWIVGVGAAVAMALLFVAGAWTVLVGVHDRIYNAGSAAERSWAQNRLRSAAWWFSEDRVTMDLLNDLAHSNLEEWQVRDKWRKARATEGR